MPRRDPTQPPKPRGRPPGTSRVVALVPAPFRVHPRDLPRWREYVARIREEIPDATPAEAFGALLDGAEEITSASPGHAPDPATATARPR